MADFRLRILKAIALAFGRSKMRNSEEHSSSQEIIRKDIWIFTALVTLWDLPDKTVGQRIYPMNYLFLLPCPSLGATKTVLCSW